MSRRRQDSIFCWQNLLRVHELGQLPESEYHGTLVAVPTALKRSKHLHDACEVGQSEFLFTTSSSSRKSDGSFDCSSSTQPASI